MRRIPWIASILAFSIPAAHAETMVVSYYDAKAPYIAAHRTLPIGTWLIVTNPRNGRSTCVMIGTRGPYTKGRDLDISEQFAKNLDFVDRGVATLETRVFGITSQADALRTSSQRDGAR
jgi:rare lipoprotein A